MKKFRALLIADQRSFCNTEMIALLKRSGFELDMITSHRFHYLYRNINRLFFFTSPDQFTALTSKLADKYQLIVPLGDVALKLITDSSLTEDEKLELLPICSAKAVGHICSKIALSERFSLANITTPPYKKLEKWETLAEEVKGVGYPALLKIDYSGGGIGTFRLNSEIDIMNVPTHFKEQPILIQKYIEGRLIDLSAFFQNGELICFSCSHSTSTINGPYGPSKQRVYYPSHCIDPRIFKELSALGKTLSAHGFCNITCIECSTTKERYYFEADMRPNDWINYPKHMADDLALRIREYFANGNIFDASLVSGESTPMEYFFVNPSRMNVFELLANRYNWVTYTNASSLLLHWLSLLPFNPWEGFKVLSVKYIKPRVSERIWGILKAKT
ncbi:MAG TPA: hypothetical protein VK967_00750 [Methylotenera sp.]|nr:hypothetical protein [Methylotenera sp.]